MKRLNGKPFLEVQATEQLKSRRAPKIRTGKGTSGAPLARLYSMWQPFSGASFDPSARE